MDFNVNNKVQVKLTDHGLLLLRQEHGRIAAMQRSAGLETEPFVPPETDAEGWSTFQLWVLMEAFGRHCYNGCILPFEPTIRIIEK